MKLDKRECRKYALPGRAPDPSRGIFHIENLDYIVCSAINLIGGHKTLVLYVYKRESVIAGDLHPVWTMFQNRDDYITLAQKADGKTAWRTSVFDNLDRNYYFITKSAFYTARDEQRVIRFCKSNDNSGFRSLRYFQHQIQAQRCKERQHARERKVIERMKGVPPIPSSLKRWAHKNVLPAYFFYDYRKRAKSVTGLCTSCGKEVTIDRARHNEKGTCPACGREFTMKSRGRRGFMHDTENYQVIQQVENGELLIRIFEAYYHYTGCEDTPKMSHLENARIFVRRTPEGHIYQEHFYNSYYKGDLTHWKQGIRPVLHFHWYARKDETCCKLYWKNLPKTLAGTPWQYCPLEQFYCVEYVPMQVLPFLEAYFQHPRLEHLVKVGFQRLATDLAYGRGYGSGLDETQNRTHRILRVSAEDIPYLKRIDVSISMLQDFQKYCERNLKDRQELHLWQMRHSIANIEGSILRLLPYMTAHKLMRYLEQQFEFLQFRLTPSKNQRYKNFNSLLGDYCDYIRMCEKERYDLTNEFVLFPKDIQKAHDRVSRQIKLKADAKMRRDFKTVCKRIMNQLDFEQSGMKILYPATPDDIVAEGHALHHCVGGYVDRVAKQECIILFLRQTEQLDKPFYTIEVRNQKVAQVRGDHNAEAPEEVTSFMEPWEKRVLQRQLLPAAA